MTAAKGNNNAFIFVSILASFHFRPIFVILLIFRQDDFVPIFFFNTTNTEKQDDKMFQTRSSPKINVFADDFARTTIERLKCD